MKKLLLLLVVLACLFLTSCATLMDEDYSPVVINTNPSGALVTVDGTPMGTTPVSLDLISDSSHSITISKEGYKTETVTVRKSVKWGWQVLDFFVTGLIGNVVDLVTPNGYYLRPSEFNLTLIQSN